jgi:hypothetical protein
MPPPSCRAAFTNFDYISINTHDFAVILSIIVLAIVLLCIYTQVATIEQLATNRYIILERFTLFAWVGLYWSMVGLAVTMGHLWILDFLCGQDGQVCGNKFLYCRPWD